MFDRVLLEYFMINRISKWYIKTVDLTFQELSNHNVRLICTFWKEYARASLIETYS